MFKGLCREIHLHSVLLHNKITYMKNLDSSYQRVSFRGSYLLTFFRVQKQMVVIEQSADGDFITNILYNE